MDSYLYLSLSIFIYPSGGREQVGRQQCAVAVARLGMLPSLGRPRAHLTLTLTLTLALALTLALTLTLTLDLTPTPTLTPILTPTLMSQVRL